MVHSPFLVDVQELDLYHTVPSPEVEASRNGRNGDQGIFQGNGDVFDGAQNKDIFAVLAPKELMSLVFHAGIGLWRASERWKGGEASVGNATEATESYVASGILR